MDEYDFTKWTEATAALPWGAQRVLKETIEAVRDEQITLVHGADYYNGSPCLINAAATMLGSIGGVGGTGKPSAHYGELVSEFDRVNAYLYPKCGGDGRIVNPLMAEFLLANFAPLKEQPSADTKPLKSTDDLHIYVERSDEELMLDFLDALKKEAMPDGATCGDGESTETLHPAKRTGE